MASLLKPRMKIKLNMEGSVNGHEFKFEGVGEGNPFEGIHEMTVTVTEGAPLPFAYDILAPCKAYGSKTFMKHEDVPDYFKQSFPEGFTWERTTAYEDGGFLTAFQTTRLLDKDTLHYSVKVLGTNFPVDGPVMNNKILGWKPWAETLYPYHGVLHGRTMMALEVQDGPPLFCHLFTTYRTKKTGKELEKLKMPEFHFGFYRLQTKRVKRVEKDGQETFQQYERSLAKYYDVPENPQF